MIENILQNSSIEKPQQSINKFEILANIGKNVCAKEYYACK